MRDLLEARLVSFWIDQMSTTRLNLEQMRCCNSAPEAGLKRQYDEHVAAEGLIPWGRHAVRREVESKLTCVVRVATAQESHHVPAHVGDSGDGHPFHCHPVSAALEGLLDFGLEVQPRTICILKFEFSDFA